VDAERPVRVGRPVTGRDAQADLRAGGRHERVRRGAGRGCVDAEHRYRGPGPDALDDPPRPDEPDAFEHARLAPEPVLGIVERRRGAVYQALHRDVAGRVVQGGEHPAQDREGVRRRPTEQSTVDGVVEHPHLHDDVDKAAQPDGQRRPPDVPVGGVGDDDDVRGDLVAVPAQDLHQGGGPPLLLAFHEDHHAHRQLVAESAQRRDVRHDAGLVIGGAPPVQAAVALDGLERPADPLGLVADRLHVVVRVEQHGRRARRRGAATDHRRLATRPHDLHVRQPGPAQQFRDGFGTAAHVVVVEAGERDARYTDQPFQIGTYAGEFTLDRGAQLGVAHGNGHTRRS
jgi:hypothetical protein